MISPFLSQRCTTSSSSTQPFRLFPLFPCRPFNLECRIRACTSVYPLSRLAIFLQNNHKKKWFNQPAYMAYKPFLFWFTFTWLWTSYRERLNIYKNTWCAFSLWHLKNRRKMGPEHFSTTHSRHRTHSTPGRKIHSVTPGLSCTTQYNADRQFLPEVVTHGRVGLSLW